MMGPSLGQYAMSHDLLVALAVVSFAHFITSTHSSLDKAGTRNMGLILHSGLHTRIIWVPIGPTTGPILELLGPI
jgi:hypothetical protein